MAFKLDDLTGKRFGKLTVLERCYDMPEKGKYCILEMYM